MKSILLAGACLMATLYAQDPVQVPIQDTLRSPINNRIFQGTMTISTNKPLTCGGLAYMRDMWTMAIHAPSHLDITLIANSSCSPAPNQYRVIFLPNNGPAWTEYWSVPQQTFPVALGIANIRTTQIVDTPTTGGGGSVEGPVVIDPTTQITQAGATTGQALCWLGTHWGPGTCGGTQGYPQIPNDASLALCGDGTWGTSCVPASGPAGYPTIPGDATLPLCGDGTFSTSCQAVVDPISSVAETNLAFSDITTANSSTSKHGLLPKLTGVTTDVLNGNGAFTSPSVTEAMLTTTDVTTANASNAKHGLLPKLPGDATLPLCGDGTFSTSCRAVADPITSVAEVNLAFSDNTTANASITKHGLMPKLPNDVTKFLDGTGAYSVPTVAETSITLTDVTTRNATTGRHGFLPKLSGSSTQFVNGLGAYSVPTVAEATITLTDVTTDDATTGRHGFLPKLSGDASVPFCGNGTFSSSCAGSGSGSSSNPDPTGHAGAVLGTTGTASLWLSISGYQTVGSILAPDGTVLAELAGNNTWTGQQYYPAGTTQTVTTTISCNKHTVDVSAGSPLTLTTTPTIANGTDGQVCVILNVGANAITLKDEASTAGSNLELNSSSYVLSPKHGITLQFSAAIGDWVQI